MTIGAAAGEDGMRVADHKKKVRRQVEEALLDLDMLEPGEDILASTLALTRPHPRSLWLTAITTVLLAAGEIADVLLRFVRAPSFLWVFAVPVMVLRSTERTVFIAVTPRRLICYQLSGISHRPVRPMFIAPLGGTQVTGSRPTLRGRAFRLDGPGAPAGGLTLTMYGSWRDEEPGVRRAIEAGGGVVDAPGNGTGRKGWIRGIPPPSLN